MLVAGYAQVICPACSSKLRVSVYTPPGKTIRCASCQVSFPYRPATEPASQPRQQKIVSCPGCSHRFGASMAADDKIKCPSCGAKITRRKSSGAAGSSRLLEEAGRPGKKKLAVWKRKKPLASPPPMASGEEPAVDFNDVPDSKPFHFDDDAGIGSESWPKPPPAKPTPVKPLVPPVKGRNRLGLVTLGLAALAAGFMAWFWLGEPSRYDVTGTVTFQGKPITYGTVILAGEDGGRINGMIQPDGSYRVAKVPSGTLRIAVFSFDPSTMPSADGAANPHLVFTPIPEEYGDLNRSGLTVAVRGPTIHNIELK